MNSLNLNVQYPQNALVNKLLTSRKPTSLERPKQQVSKDNKPASKWLTVKTSSLITGGVVLAGTVLSLTCKSKFQNLAGYLRNKITKTETLGGSSKKIYRKALNGIKRLINISSNAAVSKDFVITHCIGAKAGEKNKLIAKYVALTTKFYKNLALKAGDRRLNRAESQAERVKKAMEDFTSEMRKDGINVDEAFEDKIRDFENVGLFADKIKTHRNNNVTGQLSAKVREYILSENPVTIARNSTNIKDAGTVGKRYSDGFIADSYSAEVSSNYKNFITGIQENVMSGCNVNTHVRQVIDSIENPVLKEKYKNLGWLIDFERTSLNNKMGKIAEFESKNVVERLRDIMLGSAPVEFINPLITMGFVGAAVLSSGTKREKEYTAIEKGLPIVGGLSAAFFMSAVKLLNAPKALGLGLLTGFAFNNAAEILAKKVFPDIDNKQKASSKK